MNTDLALSLRVIEFCAIECQLQISGEHSVSWMCRAWSMAKLGASLGARPTPDLIEDLGILVEPVKNAGGFRKAGVRVGRDVKGDWMLVPGQIEQLCLEHAHGIPMPHTEWFRRYEEVHPFIDGNGRTGQILFNWLNGTLDAPVWAPNFWNDPRRTPGHGA